MNKFRAMEIFTCVVEEKTFTAAAKKLEISVVMVTKYIHALEKELKTELLQRTTRTMTVTHPGQIFYEYALSIIAKVNESYEVIEGLQAEPQGLLRVSAPMTLGKEIVAPIVAEFMSLYPKIRVELILNNHPVDLISEGYDCAFRIGYLRDYALVAKPLLNYSMSICATPAYLEKYGVPQTPDDLHHHRLLSHSTWNNSFTWRLLHEGKEIPWPDSWIMRSNDGYALREAALKNNGILMQPRFLIEADIKAGRLVALLEDYLPSPRPVHLLYPMKKNVVPKLDRFIQFTLGKYSA